MSEAFSQPQSVMKSPYACGCINLFYPKLCHNFLNSFSCWEGLQLFWQWNDNMYRFSRNKTASPLALLSTLSQDVGRLKSPSKIADQNSGVGQWVWNLYAIRKKAVRDIGPAQCWALEEPNLCCILAFRYIVMDVNFANFWPMESIQEGWAHNLFIRSWLVPNNLVWDALR